MLVVTGETMQLSFVRLLLAMVGLVCAAGCSEISGATETLSAKGPITPAGATCAVDPSLASGQFGLFQVSYACAWGNALRVARGTPLNEDGVQNSYRTMLSEGMGLVRGNCADFFRSRGDRQQIVNLSRDVVALGGTTAAAIIGLAGGSALALSIIAVTGAALYGGLDTYTKNFLFGTENIESVRTLTINALTEHATSTIAGAQLETLSFQNVAGAIMDNQELCKPAAIAAAVREAIKAGRPGIVGAGSSDSGAFSDRAIAARISEIVGLPAGVVVGDKQLAALCWATTADGMANLPKIRSVLVPEISFGSGPSDANGVWTLGGASIRVMTQCDRLSTSTRNAIDKQIEALRAAPSPAAAAAMPAIRSMPSSAPGRASSSAPGSAAPAGAPGPGFNAVIVR